jgi:hypothetical protein
MGSIKPTLEEIEKRQRQFIEDKQIQYFNRSILDIQNLSPVITIIGLDGSLTFGYPLEIQARVDEWEKRRDDYIKETYSDIDRKG